MSATDSTATQRSTRSASSPQCEPFREVEFTSDGSTLRGRLYLPGRAHAPLVVMGHGFSATIPMVMDRYAEHFCAAGLAVMAFDHRGHGSSDGYPRGEINHWVQARGYIDAINATRAIPEVRTSALALWSDSMSARIALGVTALDDRVDALLCQVPALGGELGVDDPDGLRLVAIERFLANGRWRRPASAWVSEPVVSADQTTSPSALRPLTAFRWFIEYGGRYGTGWSNRVCFTTSGDAPVLDPYACAPRVRVPTLFTMSPDDEMEGAVSAVTRDVFARLAGPKELIEVDGGHFGLLEYPSPTFDRASRAQAEFLERTLPSGATSPR